MQKYTVFILENTLDKLVSIAQCKMSSLDEMFLFSAIPKDNVLKK